MEPSFILLQPAAGTIPSRPCLCSARPETEQQVAPVEPPNGPELFRFPRQDTLVLWPFGLLPPNSFFFFSFNHQKISLILSFTACFLWFIFLKKKKKNEKRKERTTVQLLTFLLRWGKCALKRKNYSGGKNAESNLNSILFWVGKQRVSSVYLGSLRQKQKI